MRFRVIDTTGETVFSSNNLRSCALVAQGMTSVGKEAGIEEWAGDGRWEPVCWYALDAVADRRTAI